jgi:predicted unusual protein kinase regulating ubiquinone biosynthesis (AarF/ABC1/UbiB family)
MAHLLDSVAVHPTEGSEAFEQFRAAMVEFMARTWGQPMAQVHPGKLLLDMLALLRRHRIRMAPAFTIVYIAIAVTEGIARQLDPNLDLMAEAIPFFLAHPALFQTS